MKKTKVYELANQLGMSNRELMDILYEVGAPVKSHSSIVGDYAVELVIKRLKPSKGMAYKEIRVNSDLIKRKYIDNDQSNPADSKLPEDFRKIIDSCDQRIGLNPKDESAYIERAQAYFGLGELKEALKNYRHITTINPDSYKAFYGLATIYAATGADKQAIAMLIKGMDLEECRRKPE